MPSQTRKQTIGHAQVQSDLRSGGKVITARPAHFNTTPPPIDRQRLENLRNTAEGIGAISVEVERQRQIQLKKYAEKEALLGAADAKLAGERSLEQHDEYRNNAKSGFRIQGYMGEVGSQAAYSAQREHDQYVRENPMLTEEQFNDSLAGVVATNLKGMNDKHYVKSFLVGMNSYEAKARAGWEQDSYFRAQEETATAFNSVLRDDLASMPEGTPASDVGARLNQYEQGMREQGFDPDTIFENKVRMAEEHAIRTGDASIFGTDDLGIWEDDITGADGKTRPGSANSTKRNKTLTDARNRINRALVKDTTKKDKHRELAYRRQMRRLEESESPEQMAQLAKQEWDAGNLTAAQYDKALNDAEVLHKGIIHRQDVDLGVDGNRPYPEGTTTADIQDSIDRSAASVGKAARDTPDAYLEELELHNERMAVTGVMDTNTVRRIKGNLPSMNGNPAQYHRDAFYIAGLAEDSPTLVRNNIGNDVVNQNILYVDLIAQGYDSHTAYGMMVEYSTPEGRQRASDFTNEKGYYDKVDDYLDDRADDGLDNSGYAKNQMRIRIKANYMANGGNLDLAYAQAEKDVEAQFTTVTLEGTDDGDGNEIEIFFDTGGMKLPEPKLLSNTINAVTNDPVLRKKYGVPDDVVLYVGPNANDPRGPWRIYDASDDRPIVYSTGGNVTFAEVDIRKATSEYTANENKIKRDAQTKKAAEKAAANKADRIRQQKNLDKPAAQRKQAEEQRIPFAEHLTDLFD